MNGLLWIVQVILAALFFGSGLAKALMSRERLKATGQTGAAAMPIQFTRFIAVCEVLGATGLIVPCALKIHSELTALAAICLAVIMAGAAAVHYYLHEIRPVIVNVAVFVCCVLIALER